MLLGLHVQADSLSIVSYLLQERDCFRLEQTFSSVTCRSRPPFLRPNESSHRPTGRNSQVATASFLKIIFGFSLGGCFFFYCVPISMSDVEVSCPRVWKMAKMAVVRSTGGSETPGFPLGATWHASTKLQNAGKARTRPTDQPVPRGMLIQRRPGFAPVLEALRVAHARACFCSRRCLNLPPTHDGGGHCLGSIDFPILVESESSWTVIYNKPCSSESLLLLPVSQITSRDGGPAAGGGGGTDRSQHSQSKVMGEQPRHVCYDQIR